MNFEKKLQQIVALENIKLNEQLKPYTTFRVGGPATYFVEPESIQQVQGLISLCKEHQIDWFVIGNGSNLLVSDEGYDGMIISLQKHFSHVIHEDGQIRAEAGAMIAKVSNTAKKHSLTGLEFAAGIPGTVGGALVMNAGAYGGEIKDTLIEAVVLTEQGEVLTLEASQLELGYRKSCILDKKYIVLEALFGLQKGDEEKIKEDMKHYNEQRRLKQPLDKASAGSTFKRPEGHFAAKLIEDAGLKGYQIGDAAVSDKHAGFVVNLGNATSKDIINVCNYVADTVKEKFQVSLEMEVKKIGKF